MACRVGITTNPGEIEARWRRKYPKVRNWTILEGPMSRSAAQKCEAEYAERHNCGSHSDGADPDDSSASWYVYRFDY